MEEWLLTDGCDGFSVIFPYVPGGLDDFVDQNQQRRGLFRREYEGKTLRRNLGSAAARKPLLRLNEPNAVGRRRA